MNKTNKRAKEKQRRGNKEQTDRDQRGRGRRVRSEEEEGPSQRTGINDPWTRTTGWGVTVGVGGWVGQGRREQWRKGGTIVIEQQ